MRNINEARNPFEKWIQGHLMIVKKRIMGKIEPP
jgi:hypothetical protein